MGNKDFIQQEAGFRKKNNGLILFFIQQAQLFARREHEGVVQVLEVSLVVVFLWPLYQSLSHR